MLSNIHKNKYLNGTSYSLSHILNEILAWQNQTLYCPLIKCKAIYCYLDNMYSYNT